MGDDEKQAWGLLACGRSGAVDVDLNEGLHEHDLYELEIDRQPKLYLRFRLRARQVVTEMVAFLGSAFDDTRGRELHLGSLGGAAVSLVRGQKCAHSWKIVVSDPNSGVLKHALDPTDAADLYAAMRDLSSEVETE